MTNQEAFNKVWDHFVTKRNPPSIARNPASGPYCMYRSPVGPCAVGVLIPDEIYSDSWEKSSIAQLLSGAYHDAQDLQNHFSEVSLGLLSAFQDIHDGYAAVQGANSGISYRGPASAWVRRIQDTYGRDPNFWTYFQKEMVRLASHFDLKVPA